MNRPWSTSQVFSRNSLLILLILQTARLSRANCSFDGDDAKVDCMFGLWNEEKCECDCIPPYCRHDLGECSALFTCTAINPWANCEPGLNCPWWDNPLKENSCATGSEVPPGIWAIYKSQSDCCAIFPDAASCHPNGILTPVTKAPTPYPTIGAASLPDTALITIALDGLPVPYGVNVRDFQNHIREILKTILLRLADGMDLLKILDIEYRPSGSREEEMIFDIIIRREDGVDFQPIIVDAIKERLQYILDQTIIWLRYNKVDVDGYYNNQLCFNFGNDVVCSTRAPTRFPTPPPTNMKPSKHPSPRPTPRPTRYPTPNPTQDQKIIIPIEFLDISLPIDMNIADFREELLGILMSIVYEIERKYSRLEVIDVDFHSRRLLGVNSAYNNFVHISDGDDLDTRRIQRSPFDVRLDITIMRDSGVNYERIIKDVIRKKLESIMRDLLDWIKTRGFVVEEGYRFKLCFESRYGYECVEEEPGRPTNRPTRFPTPNPTEFPLETIHVEFSDVVWPFGADVDALREEVGVALKNVLLDAAVIYDNLEIFDVTNKPTSDDSELLYDVTFRGQDGVNFNFVLLQAIKSKRQEILNGVLEWFQFIGFDGSLASDFNFKYCFKTNYGFIDCSDAVERRPPTSRPTKRPSSRPSKRPSRRPTPIPTRRPTNRPVIPIYDEVIVPIKFSLDGLPRNVNMRSLASDIRALLMSLILDLSEEYSDLQVVDVQYISDRRVSKVDTKSREQRHLKYAEIAFDIILRGERGVAFYSIIRDSVRSFLDAMVEDIYSWAQVVEELTLCFLSDNNNAASGFADCATFYKPPVSGKPPSVLQPKPSNPSQESSPSISYPNPSSPTVENVPKPNTPSVTVPSPSPPDIVFIPMPSSPTVTSPSQSSPTVVFVPMPSTPTETAPSLNSPTVVLVPIPSSPTETPPSLPSSTVVVVPTPESPTIITIPSETQPNVVPTPNSPTVLIPPQTQPTIALNPSQSQPTEMNVSGPPSVANKPNGAEIEVPIDKELISLKFTVLRVLNDVNPDQLRKELKDILKVILLNLEKRYKKMNVWDIEYRCQCSREAQLERQQATRSIGLGKTASMVANSYNCDEVSEVDQSKGSRVLQSETYDFIMTFDITIARREGQNSANIISTSMRRNHEAIIDNLRQWATYHYTNNFDFDLCIESTVGKGYVVCSSDSRPAVTAKSTSSPTELPSHAPSASPTEGSAVFMTIHSNVEIAGYGIPLWVIVLVAVLMFLCLCSICCFCCIQYRKKKEHKAINNNSKVEERTIMSKDSESSSSESSDSEEDATVCPQRLYQPIMAMPQYMALPPPPQYQHQYLPAPQGPPQLALPPTTTPQQRCIQQTQNAPVLQQNPLIQPQSQPVIQSSQCQRQLVHVNGLSVYKPSDEEESSIDPSVGDIDGHTYADFESISQPDQDMYSLFSGLNGADAKKRKKGPPSSSNSKADSGVLLLTEGTHESNFTGDVQLIGYAVRPKLQSEESTSYISSAPRHSLQIEQSTRHLPTGHQPSSSLYAQTESFRYNSSRHLQNQSAMSVASESAFSALGPSAHSVWSEAPTKSSRKTKSRKLKKKKEHKSERHGRSRRIKHGGNESMGESESSHRIDIRDTFRRMEN
ncbi:hypothetical protein ACHAXS_010581 [Conticribra weissflogii]